MYSWVPTERSFDTPYFETETVRRVRCTVWPASVSHSARPATRLAHHVRNGDRLKFRQMTALPSVFDCTVCHKSIASQKYRTRPSAWVTMVRRTKKKNRFLVSGRLWPVNCGVLFSLTKSLPLKLIPIHVRYLLLCRGTFVRECTCRLPTDTIKKHWIVIQDG